MSARTEMIRWINENGAARVNDDEEILIVWAYPSGNDTILVTPNWLEGQPGGMPFHRTKGPVSETEEGWSIGPGRPPNDTVTQLRRLSDGVPEAQDDDQVYREDLDSSGRSTDEIDGLIKQGIEQNIV